MVERHGTPQFFCRFIDDRRQGSGLCVENQGGVLKVLAGAFNFDSDSSRPDNKKAQCISVFEVQGLTEDELLEISATNLPEKNIVYHVFLQVDKVRSTIGPHLNYDNNPTRHVNIECLGPLSRQERNLLRDKLASASTVYEETNVIPAIE